MGPQQPQQLQDSIFPFPMGPHPNTQAHYQWDDDDDDENSYDHTNYWGAESFNQLPSTSNNNSLSTQFTPIAPPSYPPPQIHTSQGADRAAPTANPTVAASVHQETYGFDTTALQTLLRQRMETPLTVMLIYKLMLHTY